ncbi:MAG TPA: alpha/beta fold hydrolase [Steroidobacteraceae bacterium]|jgi:pimeloyl-ACP methyl ester carboxylesterase
MSMKPMLGYLLLAVLTVGLHRPTEAQSVPARLELSPCRLADLKSAARCGVLSVPENPARASSRRLAIHIAVVPAKREPSRDPLVPLMGGPGEDAISNAAFYAEQYDVLREHRDLLLIDQRGTGKSSPLHCDLYSAAHPEINLKDVFPAERAARCEATLSRSADLTQYGYANFAQDLEAARKALGYDAFNISAGSYGTRAAQVFMRAYPKSVRTAFLGSVVPIDIAQPLPMAQTAQGALEQLFDACGQDPVCRGAFPNLRSEFAEVERHLTLGLEVSIPNHAGKAALSAGRVTEWMRSLLYRPRSAAVIPWYVQQAYGGNWAPIVAAILEETRQADRELSLGLLFAITCNEDIPFLDEAAITAKTIGTYLGDYRVREQQAACHAWPRSTLPEGYREAVHSSIPTLFVSGDADGGTPLSFMEHTAPGFSASARIVAKGQGHTEWSECVGKLYQRLVETGSARELVGAGCAPIPRPAFKITP